MRSSMIQARCGTNSGRPMAEAPLSFAERLALSFAPADASTPLQLLWAIDAQIAASARPGLDHGVARELRCLARG